MSSLKYFLNYKKYCCFSCVQKTVYTTPPLLGTLWHSEQEQRSLYWYSLQVRMETRHGCIMQFNTAEYRVKKHVWATTLTTLFMLHIAVIIHSTVTLHTVKANTDLTPPPPASTMMDELSESGLGCTLNSSQHHRPNGCVTLQQLLSRWPHPAITCAHFEAI